MPTSHRLRPDYDVSARVRERAEADIVVSLADPEAQRRHNPRSWRSHHGDSDLANEVQQLRGGGERYLDWLAIVTRDEIALLWPQVEKVAHGLVRERTLTAAEVKTLLARATLCATATSP
jgi:hypothetical protein